MQEVAELQEQLQSSEREKQIVSQQLQSRVEQLTKMEAELTGARETIRSKQQKVDEIVS